LPWLAFRTAKRGPSPAMRNHNRLLLALAKVLIFGTVAAVLGGAPARAESSLSGTYRCVSVEIAGKAKPCKAPPLEMSSDGSYTILEEHGTYEILKGQWLVLSAAKHHGRARLVGNKQIVFEFLSGGQRSKITYRRKYQRPPAWVSG
jgi:hypothetical protein